eukprot:NODE_864_length_3613_cov_0.374787.p2 type:complete len:298 gc:universal NODE_864_length_3613_cov_0.374787:1285-2178(+)
MESLFSILEESIKRIQAGLVPLMLLSVYSIFYFVNNYLVRKRIEYIYRTLYSQMKTNFKEISMWQINGPTEYYLELKGRDNVHGAVVKYNSNSVDLFSLLTRNKTVTFYAFIDRDLPVSFGISNKHISRQDLKLCKTSTLEDWILVVESRAVFDKLLNSNNLKFLNSLKSRFVSLVVSDLPKNGDEFSSDIPLTVELKLDDNADIDMDFVIKGFLKIVDDLAILNIGPEITKKGHKQREDLRKKVLPNAQPVIPAAENRKNSKKGNADDRVRLLGSMSGYVGSTQTAKKKKSNKFVK